MMKAALSIFESETFFLSSTMAFGQMKNGVDMTKVIQAFCQQYDNTWNTKGAAAVANTYFVDDAVFMSPTGAIVKGKAALAKV